MKNKNDNAKCKAYLKNQNYRIILFNFNFLIHFNS